MQNCLTTIIMAKRKYTSEEEHCSSKYRKKSKASPTKCSRSKSAYGRLKEKEGDLFSVSTKYSLAHCVAEDMGMSTGIAVEFRQKFQKVSKLLNQNVRTGGVAVLKDRKRFIYYLVTKQFSHDKPTYSTLYSSLKMLKEQVVNNKVRKLAMPRIGCGVDKLEWTKVKSMIQDVFLDVKIKIKIYTLPTTFTKNVPQQHRNARVTNLSYPIGKIEKRTMIIYMSSEDGYISSEMQTLDKMFQFSKTFHSLRKVLGNVVFYPTKDFNSVLCGCIVKKHKDEVLDFEAFENCVQQIQTASEKLRFYCTAMQVFRDKKDFAVMSKIINVLRNTLSAHHEVCICWPEDSSTKPFSAVDASRRRTV